MNRSLVVAGISGAFCALVVCSVSFAVTLTVLLNAQSQHVLNNPTGGILQRERRAVTGKSGTEKQNLADCIVRVNKKAVSPAIHLIPRARGDLLNVQADGFFTHWQHVTVTKRKYLFYDPAQNAVRINKDGVYYVYSQVHYHSYSGNEPSHCIFKNIPNGHKQTLVCGVESPTCYTAHKLSTYVTNHISGVFHFVKGDQVVVAMHGVNSEQHSVGIDYNRTYFGAFMV